MIGALATGVDVSLSKQDVASATILNNKVLSVAEAPTPEQVQLVVDSIANPAKEAALNKQVSSLINTKRALEIETTKIINAQASTINELRDANKYIQEDLSKMQSPGYAIWYGVKTLALRFLYTISGIAVAFLLLRIFAASNPIAASILGIFERITAYLINGVTTMLPKAVAFTSSFRKRDDVLKVLVDAIEALPPTATLSELRATLSCDMDLTHKEQVTEIKKELGW